MKSVTSKRKIAYVVVFMLTAAVATGVHGLIAGWRIDGLLAQAASKDPAVREKALSRLADASCDRVIERVLRHLGDSDDAARGAAVDALARIGAPAVRYAVAAVEQGPPPDPFLERIMRATRVDRWVHPRIDDTRRVRYRRTLDGLGSLFPRFGPRAIPALLDMLQSNASNVPEIAVCALGQIHDEKAFAAALEALGDKRPMVRYWAAEGLGKGGDPRAIEPLLKYQSARGDVYAHTGGPAALGYFAGDPRVDDRLVQLMSDPIYSVRLWAARGLAKSRDTRTLGVLLAAFDDEYACVREAAYQSLPAWEGPRKREALAAALLSSKKEIRSSAARVLAELCDPTAVPTLVAAYETADADGRSTIATAIRAIRDHKHAETLTSDRATACSAVRRDAAVALEKIEAMQHEEGRE